MNRNHKNHCWHPPCRRSSAGFTLVEMLTVLVVILILTAAATPAIRGFMQSENRHAAVSSVMATLDRARMMAIADGQATYVVFLARNITPDGPAIQPNLFGRGYAIYQDSDNINFVPVQRSPWLYLPQSVAFKVDSSATASVTNRLDAAESATEPSFQLPQAVLADPASTVRTHLPYLRFDGTGTVDEQSQQYLRVLLFPGIVSTNGTESVTQAGANTTSGAALLEEIDVNVATGRAKYVVNPADNFAIASTQQ